MAHQLDILEFIFTSEQAKWANNEFRCLFFLNKVLYWFFGAHWNCFYGSLEIKHVCDDTFIGSS